VATLAEPIVDSARRLIYQTLAQADWAREEAGQLFKENRPTYHPITRLRIEQALSEAAVRAD